MLNVVSSSTKQETLNWINFMLKDLRQVLNSPYFATKLDEVSPTSVDESYKTGPNFAANALVMIGIEYVGRLATGREQGQAAAVAFVKQYFPADYHECIELVWQIFRNGHTHGFLPNQVQVADATIYGQVSWIEPPPDIENLESQIRANHSGTLSNYPVHLQLTQPDPNHKIYAFSFCPQIAYVDLVLAIEEWRNDLASNNESDILFSQGILRTQYMNLAIYAPDNPIGQFLRGQAVI